MQTPHEQHVKQNANGMWTECKLFHDAYCSFSLDWQQLFNHLNMCTKNIAIFVTCRYSVHTHDIIVLLLIITSRNRPNHSALVAIAIAVFLAHSINSTLFIITRSCIFFLIVEPRWWYALYISLNEGVLYLGLFESAVSISCTCCSLQNDAPEPKGTEDMNSPGTNTCNITGTVYSRKTMYMYVYRTHSLSTYSYIFTGRKPALNSEMHLTRRTSIWGMIIISTP